MYVICLTLPTCAMRITVCGDMYDIMNWYVLISMPIFLPYGMMLCILLPDLWFYAHDASLQAGTKGTSTYKRRHKAWRGRLKTVGRRQTPPGDDLVTLVALSPSGAELVVLGCLTWRAAALLHTARTCAKHLRARALLGSWTPHTAHTAATLSPCTLHLPLPPHSNFTHTLGRTYLPPQKGRFGITPPPPC